MQPDDYMSFLVRLWREQRAEGAGWYGELEHVQSGRCWQFRTYGALLDFLADVATAPSALERLAAGEALPGEEIAPA